ncbi:hypothetical protein [Allorhodopirellula heiligendammensis]|uniref:Uncharacterized protein n=1 Tax=Allorhodopirellula heiligendammensis TaxID=2714739 RepID=A0A5C6C3Z7_9BACT|nr:hypothetical protein [Allorhodopirellula heiligendammensis]TWU18024.1 hypothetical protein Poly21_01770 [Allorhodopirellula heiligendammensis]
MAMTHPHRDQPLLFGDSSQPIAAPVSNIGAGSAAVQLGCDHEKHEGHETRRASVPAVQVSQQRGRDSRDATYYENLEDMPERRRAVYLRVLATGHGGMTLDELSVAMDRPPNAISGRVTELVAAGRLIRTERKRPTRSGGSACVLVSLPFVSEVSPAGRDPERGVTSSEPESETMATTMTRENELPDGLTRRSVPCLENGEAMIAGELYWVNRRRVLCFEGEDGELWMQPLLVSLGPDPEGRPQRVLELPPRGVRIELLE